jgi:hypothetical protein
MLARSTRHDVISLHTVADHPRFDNPLTAG